MTKKMWFRRKPLPEWWTDWLTEIVNEDTKIVVAIMIVAIIPVPLFALGMPFIANLGTSDNAMNWISGSSLLIWLVVFSYLGYRKLDYHWAIWGEATRTRNRFYEDKAATYL